MHTFNQNQSVAQLIIHSSTQPSICPSFRSFMHTFNHSYIHSTICSFIHLTIHLFSLFLWSNFTTHLELLSARSGMQKQCRILIGAGKGPLPQRKVPSYRERSPPCMQRTPPAVKGYNLAIGNMTSMLRLWYNGAAGNLGNMDTRMLWAAYDQSGARFYLAV